MQPTIGFRKREKNKATTEWIIDVPSDADASTALHHVADAIKDSKIPAMFDGVNQDRVIDVKTVVDAAIEEVEWQLVTVDKADDTIVKALLELADWYRVRRNIQNAYTADGTRLGDLPEEAIRNLRIYGNVQGKK